MSHLPLLDEVIEAHGGLERWERVRKLVIHARVGGNILAARFKSPRLRTFELTVDACQIHAVLDPFPKPGLRGIFEGNWVWIETGGGSLVAQREIVRTVDGKVARRMVWDHLDLLYFLGYALWNYSVTPYYFLWQGFQCFEEKPWKEKDGSVWRRLRVIYPPAFPTHSQEQTFYFDSEGLLQRLDYTADVFSPRAKGAHYCSEHRTFDGLVFPTHRKVFWRLPSGHPFRLTSVMEGWVLGVEALGIGR